MQQATDFLEESRDLYALVKDLEEADLQRQTGFKQWTIETILRHLHFWNRMALFALTDEDAFRQALAPVMRVMASGGTLPTVEVEALPVGGRELVAEWRELFELLAAEFGAADPSHRCAWAGPSMSARSCITARQMETWAHGQAIYDELGVVREDADRIRNIVVLGVNTFAWSFQVRGETPPGPVPMLNLTSPSGERWHFGESGDADHITGLAVEFAQVVTQTRNIADTALMVVGDVASRWMQNAQCFAGGANPPPAPGTRFRRN